MPSAQLLSAHLQRIIRRVAAAWQSVAFAVSLVALSTGSFAQVPRNIPDDAPRARLTHITELEVEVNGRRAELSANARVISDSNLVIVPSAIPPDSVVRYRLDADRRIDRVWVLTADEAAAPLPQRNR